MQRITTDWPESVLLTWSKIWNRKYHGWHHQVLKRLRIWQCYLNNCDSFEAPTAKMSSLLVSCLLWEITSTVITLLYDHPYYEDRYQMHRESKILKNTDPLWWPLFHSRGGGGYWTWCWFKSCDIKVPRYLLTCS